MWDRKYLFEKIPQSCGLRWRQIETASKTAQVTVLLDRTARLRLGVSSTDHKNDGTLNRNREVVKIPIFDV